MITGGLFELNAPGSLSPFNSLGQGSQSNVGSGGGSSRTGPPPVVIDSYSKSGENRQAFWKVLGTRFQRLTL